MAAIVLLHYFSNSGMDILQAGFKYHHAEQAYLMLTYWIPEGPCLLPANASHQVGVGGFVVSEKNEVCFFGKHMYNFLFFPYF